MYDNAVAALRQLILSVFLLLFHGDCFDRTGVDTDAAIDAGVGVDFGFAVSHADSFAWTLWDTTFTAGAFFFIYFCWHLHNPFLNDN
jgi:hypothetical protein